MPNDLKSELRDFKLSIVTGDYKVKIDPSVIPSDKMEFIISKFPDGIITGSIALLMYGLLARGFQDFDIIIDDRNLFPSYSTDRYGDEEIGNRLGYRDIEYKSGIFSRKKTYKVDFFENNGAKYNSFVYKGNTYKVQDLLEIIDHKMVMANNSTKHFRDLQNIFYYANLSTTNNYKPGVLPGF
jgi:hypothetical protein